MTGSSFFRGFFAALRKMGVTFVDTRQDLHHERFGRVAELLSRDAGEDPGMAEMPKGWAPNMFTGRYSDFDQYLVELQDGLLGARNPIYPGVDITIRRELADRILDRYPPDQRRAFERLAQVYIGGQ